MIFLAVLAYIFAVYGFTVAYSFVFTLDTHSFNQTNLSMFDFFYFSVVTMATVGYGDITPASFSAKVLVISEIWFSYMYSVFVLAVIASEAVSRRNEPSGILKKNDLP